MLRMRSLATLATIACAAGGTVAVATASAGMARPPSTHTVKLTLKSTSLGKILVTNGGVIVYIFTKDKHGKNTCPASNGCAAQWPPLVGTPSLGAGVKKSLVGHIKDGSKSQITYNGHPLYGYIYNSTSTSYVGYVQFGGAWQAINAKGSIVKGHDY